MTCKRPLAANAHSAFLSPWQPKPPRRPRSWALIAALALIGVALICGLGGCGAQTSSPHAEAAAQHAKQQNAKTASFEHIHANDPDAVEITVVTPSLSFSSLADPETTTTYDFLTQVAQDFEKNYTDQKVVVNVREFDISSVGKTIDQLVAEGEAPNVLLENFFNMEQYIHDGYALPLDDIISDELKADIDPEVWEMAQVDGKTYMMPFYSYENILAYNKELFRKAGLEDYIEDGYVISSWTPEQWDEVLSKLTALEVGETPAFPMMMYAASQMGDTHLMVLLRSKGSSFFDSQGNFNLDTPQGIAALRWIKESYDKGYFPPVAENLTIDQISNLFYDGRIGIHLYNIVYADRTPVEDFGYVNFPNPSSTSADPRGYATSFMTGFEVFDTGSQEQIEASKAFVAYVLETEEWANYSAGMIPARNSIANAYASQSSELNMFLQNDAEIVDFTARNPNWDKIREIFYPYIHDLLTGKKTPEQVAQELDTKANAILEEGRAQSNPHS